MKASTVTTNGIDFCSDYWNLDHLGRAVHLAMSSSKNSDGGLIKHWNYVDGNKPNSTTSLIKDVIYNLRQNGEYSINPDLKFSYEYDEMGNITDVKDKDNNLIVHYEYDKLNQLKRENNVATGETVIYSYDLGGNILKKEFYTYNDGTSPLQLQREVNYAYSDNDWKDKLTSYDGQEIIYDGIGNPVQYKNGWTFEWARGRKVDKMLNSCYNIECKYDNAGIRTQKAVTENGITKITDFVTSGMQILAQKTGDDTIVYQIDGNGSVLGFMYNEDVYYYLKNTQNDIVGIVNAAGEIKATYIYDAWGKVTVQNEPGTDIGDVNPLRYRGYYYDSETGLYYLNARYYDPETGRFINADDNLDGGFNLFAYCYNNPIQFVDPTGLAGILQIFSHEHHAWIAYTEQVEYIDNQGIKQTKNVKTQTIGTWGEHLPSGRQSGIHYDMEANGIANRGWYKGRVSLSANITDEQEKNLFDFIAKNNNWSMFKNCSWFAANAWEAAGQKSLGYRALGIVPTPTVLARSIKSVTGYQTNAPIVSTGTPINPQEGNSSWNPRYILDDLSYLWKQI